VFFQNIVPFCKRLPSFGGPVVHVLQAMSTKFGAIDVNRETSPVQTVTPFEPITPRLCRAYASYTSPALDSKTARHTERGRLSGWRDSSRQSLVAVECPDSSVLVC